MESTYKRVDIILSARTEGPWGISPPGEKGRKEGGTSKRDSPVGVPGVIKSGLGVGLVLFKYLEVSSIP